MLFSADRFYIHLSVVHHRIRKSSKICKLNSHHLHSVFAQRFELRSLFFLAAVTFHSDQRARWDPWIECLYEACNHQIEQVQSLALQPPSVTVSDTTLGSETQSQSVHTTCSCSSTSTKLKSNKFRFDTYRPVVDRQFVISADLPSAVFPWGVGVS